MRKNSDLICWARAWHWPQLVIDPEQSRVVRAGEESWRTFAARPDRKAKLQAWQRIHRWNTVVEAIEEAQQQQLEEIA